MFALYSKDYNNRIRTYSAALAIIRRYSVYTRLLLYYAKENEVVNLLI